MPMLSGIDTCAEIRRENRQAKIIFLSVSPEFGVTIFPFEATDFGFHMAAYYSFATNRNKAVDINGINNVGFKLGVAF